VGGRRGGRGREGGRRRERHTQKKRDRERESGVATIHTVSKLSGLFYQRTLFSWDSFSQETRGFSGKNIRVG